MQMGEEGGLRVGHVDQELGQTCTNGNALISCANDKDLEQPVHLQSIYMANLNFLHFITYEISFLFCQCCAVTVNMAIHVHLILPIPHVQVLCNITLYL